MQNTTLEKGYKVVRSFVKTVTGVLHGVCKEKLSTLIDMAKT